jgi:Putative Actinobacterial Holin-X, holin superfamily III
MAANTDTRSHRGTANGAAADGSMSGVEPKLSTLVTDATRDLSALVREEIALAKAELRYDMKQAAIGGGLFGAAALFALFAVIVLSFAAAYGIHATGLGLAWSWLIVGGAYLLIAVAAAGIGMMRLKKLRMAEATKRTAGESIATLRSAAR